MSDIQDYIEYNIIKHETLTTIPPIHVYVKRINNRFVFKMKDGYKLELETTETMKLSKAVELFLVQCNLVETQYQQKSKVLYTFTPNISYAYLVDVEPSNLVFLKTYNTDSFSGIQLYNKRHHKKQKPRKMTNNFFDNYIFVHTFQWTSSECLTNVTIPLL